MIAHLVLFSPATSLTQEQRERLVTSLENAFSKIPHITRAHVGRRRLLGRPYDALAREQFAFAAVLEFESEEALRAYLDHPAHAELGRQFYQSAEAALVHDFEMVPGDQLRRLL